MGLNAIDSDEASTRDIPEPVALGSEAIPVTDDQRMMAYLKRELELCGPVSSNEAHESLVRFCNSHFRNSSKDHARITIPADPRRDDDLRLGAFIARAELAFRLVAKLRGLKALHRPSAVSDLIDLAEADEEIRKLGIDAPRFEPGKDG
jgi:hypothetical protein